MIVTTKTRAGWVIHTTATRDDCLLAGGYAGRRVLYTRHQLAEQGLKYEDHPYGIWCDGVTNEQYLLQMIKPHKVLTKGRLIQ